MVEEVPLRVETNACWSVGTSIKIQVLEIFGESSLAYSRLGLAHIAPAASSKNCTEATPLAVGVAVHIIYLLILIIKLLLILLPNVLLKSHIFELLHILIELEFFGKHVMSTQIFREQWLLAILHNWFSKNAMTKGLFAVILLADYDINWLEFLLLRSSCQGGHQWVEVGDIWRNGLAGWWSGVCWYDDHSCCATGIGLSVSNLWLLQSLSIHHTWFVDELLGSWIGGRTTSQSSELWAPLVEEMSLVFLQYSEEMGACCVETKVTLIPHPRVLLRLLCYWSYRLAPNSGGYSQLLHALWGFVWFQSCVLMRSQLVWFLWPDLNVLILVIVSRWLAVASVHASDPVCCFWLCLLRCLPYALGIKHIIWSWPLALCLTSFPQSVGCSGGLLNIFVRCNSWCVSRCSSWCMRWLLLESSPFCPCTSLLSISQCFRPADTLERLLGLGDLMQEGLKLLFLILWWLRSAAISVVGYPNLHLRCPPLARGAPLADFNALIWPVLHRIQPSTFITTLTKPAIRQCLISFNTKTSTTIEIRGSSWLSGPSFYLVLLRIHKDIGFIYERIIQQKN